MLISNTQEIPGKTVVEFFGVVSGSTVRAKHIGRDIAAGLKNVVGGELRGYTELLAEARGEAIRRIAKTDPSGMDLAINFIAINKRGEFGAAGTQANFPYSVTTPEFSEVRKGKPLSQATQKEGGNE